MSFITGPRSHTTAYVNKEHRLEVEATAVTEALKLAEKGMAYNIGSGVIALTDTTSTPILYLENHEDHEIVVEEITGGFDDLGTHTGTPIIKIVRNPTALDFNAAAGTNANRNCASTKTLKTTTLVYKGAVGDTITAGTTMEEILHKEGDPNFCFGKGIVVGVGNSICVLVDGQVTSGTGSVFVNAKIYIHENID